MADNEEEVEVTPVHVETSVTLRPNILEEALRKSQVYWEVIKPRLDLAKFIETLVSDTKAFYTEFYTNEPKTLEEFLKLIEKYRRA